MGDAEDPERKVLGFVVPEKGARHYVRRYLGEPEYKAWFDRNYPDYTFYHGIGITEEEFKRIATDLDAEQAAGDDSIKNEGKRAPPQEPEPGAESPDVKTEMGVAVQQQGHVTDPACMPEQESAANVSDGSRENLAPRAEKEATGTGSPRGEDLAKTVFDSYMDSGGSYDRRTFEEFVDERILISRDLFGKKEMKVKILEVSDELQDSKIRWKFGDRVKVNKILVTIKHLDTMEVEEGEFDIEAIEKELAEKRHWSSTNRWVPSTDIKNGYVVNSKHTALISDAVALDYIIF